MGDEFLMETALPFPSQHMTGGSCDFMFTENRNQKHMDGIEGFRETCRLKQGAVAYFDGVINHRGRHSTGKTTGAQERLVLVIRAAVNTSYAEAEKPFRV